MQRHLQGRSSAHVGRGLNHAFSVTEATLSSQRLDHLFSFDDQRAVRFWISLHDIGFKHPTRKCSGHLWLGAMRERIWDTHAGLFLLLGTFTFMIHDRSRSMESGSAVGFRDWRGFNKSQPCRGGVESRSAVGFWGSTKRFQPSKTSIQRDWVFW